MGVVLVAASTPAAEQTYTVQPGDQLKNIAARYGVSIWDLVAADQVSDPDHLRVGQTLRVRRR